MGKEILVSHDSDFSVGFYGEVALGADQGSEVFFEIEFFLDDIGAVAKM